KKLFKFNSMFFLKYMNGIFCSPLRYRNATGISSSQSQFPHLLRKVGTFRGSAHKSTGLVHTIVPSEKAKNLLAHVHNKTHQSNLNSF
ncbi:MAG: hypothetical protein IJT39_02330, partial [Bacteroidales bacterium]|nr:hypothetical protein [Bacteroidales bacterium]